MLMTADPERIQSEKYRSVGAQRGKVAEMRINRTLLWSHGERASAVAMRVVDLSDQLFVTAPPLRHISPTSERSLVQQMAEACDQLAESALVTALHRGGYTLAQNNELHLWIVVSEDGAMLRQAQQPNARLLSLSKQPAESAAERNPLTGDGAMLRQAQQPDARLLSLSKQPAESAAERNPLTGDGDGFAESVEMLRAIAWQRLRAHLATHTLLLAEPSDEDSVAGWRQMLQAQIDGLCTVAGPVNHHHMRLPSDQWNDQAACALTSLLWCARPNHSEIDRSAASVGVAAIGGEIWRSPRAALQTWLCVNWASGLTAQLSSLLQSPATPSGQWVHSLEQLSSSLNAVASPAPAAASADLWRNWRPGWAALVDLPATLLRRVESRSQPDQVRQQQARMAWVGRVLSECDRELATLNERLLKAARQWPRLGTVDAELRAWRKELQQQAEEIGASLEAAGARVATAQSQLEQAQHDVTALCNQFPACSWQGVLATVLQPWRWPAWLWAYWVDAPRTSQRLFAAHARLMQALGEEANFHALRQVNLALMQTVQKQLTRLHGLRQRLVQLQQVLSEQQQALARQIPAPWTDERLAGLAQRMLGDGAELAWVLLAQNPVLTWPVIDAEDSAGLAAFADVLIDHARQIVEPIADWSALECMMAAFSTQDTANGRDEQREWLDDLLLRAAPLWPPQDAAHDRPGESWLLRPPVLPNRESPSWLAAEMDGFDAWCDEHPQLLCAQSNLDAVCVLQWSA